MKGTTIQGRPIEWSGYSIPDGLGKSLINYYLNFLPGIQEFSDVKQFEADLASKEFDVIVSCRPKVTAWAEYLILKSAKKVCHLAFTFNYTDLPKGLSKFFVRKMYKTVDYISVITNGEVNLYHEYFGIDKTKILVDLWGVAPPIETALANKYNEPYICALGGEARDYHTVCETARSMPNKKFVVIARPHNFKNIEIPDNLDVFFNIPHEQAWSYVYHSKILLIPLTSRDTPCGIVTLVGAMHLAKPIIVTDAMGVADYIDHNKSGMLVRPKDTVGVCNTIERLENQPHLSKELGKNAKLFADKFCTEESTVNFFSRFLRERVTYNTTNKKLATNNRRTSTDLSPNECTETHT